MQNTYICHIIYGTRTYVQGRSVEIKRSNKTPTCLRTSAICIKK